MFKESLEKFLKDYLEELEGIPGQILETTPAGCFGGIPREIPEAIPEIKLFFEENSEDISGRVPLAEMFCRHANFSPCTKFQVNWYKLTK